MLHIANVKKSFGDKKVISDVSFQVKKGESFGLLGPNGAGKSTLIGMICGLIPMDQGDIQVGGCSVSKEPMTVRKKIGVVPQDIALYPTMSAKDNLVFWGKMYGLTGKDAKRKAEEVLDIVGLTERGKDKIETFSGGMKRRINIGAALMHEPELLIMDEPTVGIDPQSRNHILETVKKLNEKGMTVVYTSHYMEEVDYLCERIVILDHGKVIASGEKTDLCQRLAGGIVIHLKVDQLFDDYIAQLQAVEGVKRVDVKEENSLDLFVMNKELLGELVSVSTLKGIQVLSIHVNEPNLETLFLQLTGRSLRD
ncbi:ABC transporter ATP-binding protein [Bacillus sp. FJAT-52991]|uniref:ABC transporter ATP-binding protein n=1 Tax=Bacillus kandeliae TaxID=3129297 RepID=A0ABZ2N4Y1_9BACI